MNALFVCVKQNRNKTYEHIQCFVNELLNLFLAECHCETDTYTPHNQ